MEPLDCTIAPPQAIFFDSNLVTETAHRNVPGSHNNLNLSGRAKFCASSRPKIILIPPKLKKRHGVQVWTDSDGLGARCIGETRFSCAWDIAIFVRVTLRCSGGRETYPNGPLAC